MLASLHAGTVRKRSLLGLCYRRSRPDGDHASQRVDPRGGPHRDRNFDSNRGSDLVRWLGNPACSVGATMKKFRPRNRLRSRDAAPALIAAGQWVKTVKAITAAGSSTKAAPIASSQISRLVCVSMDRPTLRRMGSFQEKRRSYPEFYLGARFCRLSLSKDAPPPRPLQIDACI